MIHAWDGLLDQRRRCMGKGIGVIETDDDATYIESWSASGYLNYRAVTHNRPYPLDFFSSTSATYRDRGDLLALRRCYSQNTWLSKSKSMGPSYPRYLHADLGNRRRYSYVLHALAS